MRHFYFSSPEDFQWQGKVRASELGDELSSILYRPLSISGPTPRVMSHQPSKEEGFKSDKGVIGPVTFSGAPPCFH